MFGLLAWWLTRQALNALVESGIVNIRDVEIHLAAITCLRSSTAPWKHAIKVSSHIFNLIFDLNLLARILTRLLYVWSLALLLIACFFLGFRYSATMWQISKLLPETVLLLLPQALIWLYSCWQMLLCLLVEVKQLLLHGWHMSLMFTRLILATWILCKGSHFRCIKGSFIRFVPHMGLVKRMVKNSCFLSCILAFELRRRNSNWWGRSGLFVSSNYYVLCYGLDFPCGLRLRWSYLV